MRHLTKLAIVLLFASAAVVIFLNDAGSRPSAAQTAKPAPTPPANANTSAKPPANTAANTSANTAAATTPQSGDKKIPKSFVLGQNSQDEHGEVPFDHDTHAFKNYSPDGKSPIACVECHHTDQPKSALKPPLLTSERDVALTFESWKGPSEKIKQCRSCHFQSVDIPEGATMPTATYNERGKEVVKDLNNELAYHINCNTCHDAAAALRPELKSRPGFAVGADCKTCHRPN
jgi:hypothetical protein